MTKFSGITPLSTMALADFLLGVTSGNVDFRITNQNLVTFLQSNLGMWWLELGRATATGSVSNLNVSFTPKKYLMILMATIGGNGDNLQFNGDTGSNYSLRQSDNGGADGTFVSQNGWTSPGSATIMTAEHYIVNLATQEKTGISHYANAGSAGAGNVTNRREKVDKWANTSAQISSVKVTAGGSYSAGSELIILGHD